jgi:hypothetical protein
MDGPHIGILGSAQSWKNMECQIVAAAMVENSTIHVQELKHPEVLRRLGILGRIVVHPKTLTDSEYYSLVGGMHVNMCVSLSEVYSYLTAESFLMETPVLTGTITPLVQRHVDARLSCGTTCFEDPMNMANQLEGLLKATGGWGWLRKHMLEINEDHRKICQEELSKWV